MGAAEKTADAEKQPAGTWGAAAKTAGAEEGPAGTWKAVAEAAGTKWTAEETAETNDEGPGTAKRTEMEVVEAPGPKRGAEEGTGDERRGAEDAKRPTEVGARKKESRPHKNSRKCCKLIQYKKMSGIVPVRTLQDLNLRGITHRISSAAP